MNRGFKVAAGFTNVTLPTRSTKNSAGYDFRIIEDLTINKGEVCLAKTGVKAYMQKNEVLKIYPRSSLAVKKHLNLANNVGIIDADYYENPDNDGHIMVALYNFGTESVTLLKGERIAQGIFEQYLLADDDVAVADRKGGFGSTKSN